MPATYEVVKKVIQKTFEKNSFDIQSILDIGAGTGSGSIAISELLSIQKIYCYEKIEAMQKVGKDIMKNGNTILKNAEWKNFDFVKDNIEIKPDLIICSYVINEIDKSYRSLCINKLYNATNNLIILIEPGTPEGFKNIIEAREILLTKGMHIVAPCTHEGKCEILENDWCNCMTRINREKIHKELKGGVAPYEDEKFSYIVFSKNNVELPSKRILRHPIINSGFIKFKVCTSNGILQEVVSKKQGDYYKRAKKLSIGDILE